MRILIIEDEPPIRETLQELLELNGHTVLAAADGPAGVRLAERHPDLILCDVGLPGLDGYEVITAVQQRPECHDIPFIFLTARADRESQRRGMALGADDYITKPFTQRDLIDAINARVRRQQPLRERIGSLLNEHRSEIGADWAHELMTPLNSVLGGLELIEQEADTIQPGELRELLGLIRAGAERQQALARKLVLFFELERLKANPASGRPSFCSAASAITEGATRAAGAEHRAPDLGVRCAPGEVPLGEELLSSAVAELAGNAFRFSKPGQPVTITGTPAADRYRIEVTDHGPGLTAEQCARIGPFVQFDRSRREQQGLGLGLAIAQAVAQVAGGRLFLAPVPEGTGLRVTLDVPLLPAP